MARGLLLSALAIALVSGCGRSLPSTPMERGAAMVHEGRYGDAIDAYTEAIHLQPRDAKAYLLRGRAYHARNETGDLQAAIADFSAAIDFSPKDSEAFYSRSMAYRDVGQADKAHEDSEMARKLDGLVVETYSQLPESLPEPLDVDAITAQATAEAHAARPPIAEDEPTDGDDLLVNLRRRLDAEAKTDKSKEQGGGAFSSGGTRPPGSARDYEERGSSRSNSGRRNPVAERRRAAAGGGGTANTQPSADAPRAPVDPARRADSPLTRDPRFGPIMAPGSAQQTPAPYGAGSNVRPGFTPSLGTGYPTSAQGLPQSPFPQRAPRPTGFVEEQPFGQPRPQSRSVFDNPNAISPPRPTNQLPGARHGDYNP